MLLSQRDRIQYKFIFNAKSVKIKRELQQCEEIREIREKKDLHRAWSMGHGANTYAKASVVEPVYSIRIV